VKTPKTRSSLEVHDETDFGSVSKSAKKREMRYIQDLAAQLVELSPGDFAAMPLDEDLRHEVELARKVKAHGARRRQLRFLGQYIAGMEHGAVENALAALKSAKTAEIAKFHGLEALRDGLMACANESDKSVAEMAIEQVMTAFPHADRQQVRTLARNVQKEQSGAGRLRVSRAIFQYLKSLSGQKTKSEEEEE